MRTDHVIIIVWLGVVVGIIITLIINGRKALKKFPKFQDTEFEYIENFASGYSTDLKKTKKGAARNALRIRVSEDELWLTSHMLLAGVAEKFDLLHLIPLKSVISITSEENQISVKFVANEKIKNIVIISKNHQELVELLRAKTNTH